ncbi:MAG: hypothetical protein Q8914_00175 [Bacteroidota bacterium]|nr:hypothetical protein [Bacteroidota bacterium]
MNKQLRSLVVLFLMMSGIHAQEYLYINNDDGISNAFKIGSIDSMTFVKPEGYTVKTILTDTVKITYPGEVDLINTGTYGAENAVYYKSLAGIADFRVVFDFRINQNCNEGNSNVTICQLSGADKNIRVMLKERAPSILMTTPYDKENTTCSQQIGFNSGFIVIDDKWNGVTYNRKMISTQPLVGNTAFQLWLKGNYAKTVELPDPKLLIARQDFLDNYRDLAVMVANDTFSIIRDGLDCDNVTTYNNGITSTIWSTSLKTADSTYKKISSLYEEIKTASAAGGALSDYGIDLMMMDLTLLQDCSGLLQFGKIKLVGYYYQQIDPSSRALGYYYDSFPVDIRLWKDESRHTVEMVRKSNDLYVAVDGQTTLFAAFGSATAVYIGGSSSMTGYITAKDIEIDLDHTGDALIKTIIGSTPVIVSSRTPQILGLMTHRTEDIYEGDTLSVSYNQSLSRLEDALTLLQQEGYTLYGTKELANFLNGSLKPAIKSAFILITDAPWRFNWNDQGVRSIYTQYGYPIIFGSILAIDEIDDNGTMLLDDIQSSRNMILAARGNNIDAISHTWSQDVYPPYKNALVLQWELYKIIDVCDSLCMNSVLYSYGPGCNSENHYSMLRRCGFIGSIGSGGFFGSYTNLSTNHYQICRGNIIGDKISWATVEKYIRF